MCSHGERYVFFFFHTKGPPWRPEFEGTATGADQLVQEILKESESRVSSFTNGCVLVLVNRKRTAEYLAAYLNNCPELRLRNIGTTSSVGHVGGSDGEGKKTNKTFVISFGDQRAESCW